MRKRKKSEEGGFNVWRSYSDMMAGVLLLFILIMCVTLFQAQKSYNESIKERDDKIALQEQYTAEILAQQSELDEKNSKLSSQDEQLDKQKKLLAELAAQLKEQQASLDEKTSALTPMILSIFFCCVARRDVFSSRLSCCSFNCAAPFYTDHVCNSFSGSEKL